MADQARYRCATGEHEFTELPAGARRCPHCLSPLQPAQTPAAAAPATPADGPGTALRTAHELRVVFPDIVLTVPRGEQLMLGRDPDYSPHADYFGGYHNVSRRHAVVGLESGGRAWIRDHYATNLTKVNTEPMKPGTERELRNGDRVRLCANLHGRIELSYGASDVA